MGLNITPKTINDIICDICEESTYSGDANLGDFEYAKLSAQWGYYSEKDLTEWEYYMCESCADKIHHMLTQLQGIMAYLKSEGKL